MAGETELSYVLPQQAYEPLPDGVVYRPVVPAEAAQPELTWRAVLIGVLAGVFFGAANAYLGLKVGLTVSASIPAAVIGVAVFRALRGGTLLETNIVQTIGSAGESLAAGVIFTLPVLFLWGEEPGFWPIFPLALLGGLLGVLFMVPLRRALIVAQHGHLTYPEGTACAEVQVAAQAGGDQARLLFAGIGVGAAHQGLQKLLGLWSEEPEAELHLGDYRTAIGASLTPELLGVGFIIGPKVASVMLAGGVLGWLVIIPLIYVFGGHAGAPIPPEASLLVDAMSPGQLWNRYLRYVGAGAVAFGGLFTLVKSIPTLLESFRVALAALGESGAGVARTDQDLSLKVIGGGLLAVFGLVTLLPLMRWTDAGGPHLAALGPLAALAVIVFGFFFVTVSSRIVGLLGSSSNPISGMTIATVLLCALLFGKAYGAEQAKVAVLTIGALVCIAAAIAGDTSQDLKTGFLVGATPRRQQVGEIVGVITAALAMSTVLYLFRDQVVDGSFKAPQANLIRLVIDGVVDGGLPWGLVAVGVACAIVVELMGLPTLAFAVGLYLPLALGVPVIAGGLLRWLVDRRADPKERFHRREQGVLFSSGLIAGAALLGVLAAGLTWAELKLPDLDLGAEGALSVAAFAALAGALGWVTLRRRADAG